MNAFDFNVLLGLNRLADRWPSLNQLALFLYEDSLKSALVVALLWWAWFGMGRTDRGQEIREKILASYVGCLIGIVLVRLMAVLLPFRARPLTQSGGLLHFALPKDGWVDWSAFPSDHAVLFFFLGTTLFSVAPALGIVALLDGAFLICLPRVFLGVHHPTDILAGAAIGVAGGCLAIRPSVRARLAAPGLKWLQTHPPSFFATAFLMGFLTAQVFWPATRIVKTVVQIVRTTVRDPAGVGRIPTEANLAPPPPTVSRASPE